MGNAFSMTARSGDLQHSLINVLFVRCIAARVEAEFWRDLHLVKTFGYILCQQLRTGDQNGYL